MRRAYAWSPHAPPRACSLPAILLNIAGALPVYFSFAIFGCMVFGGLTERFDGLPFSAITLFAVRARRVAATARLRRAARATFACAPLCRLQTVTLFVSRSK